MVSCSPGQAALLAAALAAGSACADNDLQPVNGVVPSGPRQPPPPPLGACVDVGDGQHPPGSASIEGQVEAVGLGAPGPADYRACPLGGELRFGDPYDPSAELAQTSWMRLRDGDDREVVVSALAEGFAFPVAVGDAVRARIDVETIGFGAEVNSFEARSADGALLFWLGMGLRLSDLDPPSEVSVSPGAVDETVEDDCVGSYQLRSLDVVVNGAAVSPRSGARAELGPWMVVNALTREQTGMSVCPDAFADAIEVALWTLDGRVRETGGVGGPCYAQLPIGQSEGAPGYRCLPDGTLTRECGRSSPCPGVSECVAGLCAPPSD